MPVKIQDARCGVIEWHGLILLSSEVTEHQLLSQFVYEVKFRREQMTVGNCVAILRDKFAASIEARCASFKAVHFFKRW